MPEKLEYRVFISYFHQDSELVDQIVTILQENGLRPMLDKDFSFGGKFKEQIKNFITALRHCGPEGSFFQVSRTSPEHLIQCPQGDDPCFQKMSSLSQEAFRTSRLKATRNSVLLSRTVPVCRNLRILSELGG